ncbi:oligosaccharide flippase family protein [Blautia sp. HCP28S3_G10]|uniref:oligosaccharide flippase family protein n=1 Tax=Blautia sp. HCP28S3_G10 TaxID=3438908 RepID=UPI003F888E17
MNDSISRKQISINMIANIVSYSANIIISFVLTPFLINTLGKETYSFYPMANTIVSYMSVLTNAMNSIASRFVTVSIVQKRKEDANKYYSSTLAANLLMSLIMFVPMLIVVVFLDTFMDVPVNSVAAIKTLFALVFASALINISASVFGIATFAKNRIDLRSVRELVTASLRLVLFIVLYKFLTPSIIYVGIVTLVVAIVNIIFQVNYTRFLLPEIKLKKKYISSKHTRELLSSSCWNAINSFGNTLLAGMSMILANMFYGATASGSYSIVNTVPQFICGIIVMLTGVFYPVITYKYAENDKKGLIYEVKKAQKMVGIFGCAVIATFSSLATEFFTLWTPNENAIFLAELSFVTILPHFVIACMWSLTNLNVVMNKLKVPALYTLGSGIVNIFLAYVSYKLFHPGLISLPLISSILQIVWVGIFIPLYVCRNLNVNWKTFYAPIVRAIVCSVGVMMLIINVKQFFILNSWVKFLLFGGVSGVLALCIFAVGMLGTDIIKSLKNK